MKTADKIRYRRPPSPFRQKEGAHSPKHLDSPELHPARKSSFSEFRQSEDVLMDEILRSYLARQDESAPSPDLPSLLRLGKAGRVDRAGRETPISSPRNYNSLRGSPRVSPAPVEALTSPSRNPTSRWANEKAQWRAAVVLQRWYRRILSERNKKRAMQKEVGSERKKRFSLEEDEERRRLPQQETSDPIFKQPKRRQAPSSSSLRPAQALSPPGSQNVQDDVVVSDISPISALPSKRSAIPPSLRQRKTPLPTARPTVKPPLPSSPTTTITAPPSVRLTISPPELTPHHFVPSPTNQNFHQSDLESTTQSLGISMRLSSPKAAAGSGYPYGGTTTATSTLSSALGATAANSDTSSTVFKATQTIGLTFAPGAMDDALQANAAHEGRGVTSDTLRLSSEKISSILQFLNEAEATVDLSTPTALSNSVPLSSEPAFSLTTEPAFELTAASSVPHYDVACDPLIVEELRAQVERLELELEQRTQAIDDLQAQLKKSREREERIKKACKESEKRKLDAQRSEVEDVINRQQSLIDKLAAEKEQVTAKCNRITEEMGSFDAKVKEKVDSLRERLEREKETWQQQFIKKTECEFKEREKAKLESMQRQKDEEIETLRRKFDSEKAQMRAALVKEHESELKSMRDKYMSAVRAQATAESEAKESRKAVESKQRAFDERQKEMERLHGQLGEVWSRQSKLEKDFDEQVALRTRAEQERDELREELSRSEAARQAEIQELRRKKAAELDKLSVKVRQIVAKKEETIKQLREQLEECQGRLKQTQTILMETNVVNF